MYELLFPLLATTPELVDFLSCQCVSFFEHLLMFLWLLFKGLLQNNNFPCKSHLNFFRSSLLFLKLHLKLMNLSLQYHLLALKFCQITCSTLANFFAFLLVLFRLAWKFCISIFESLHRKNVIRCGNRRFWLLCFNLFVQMWLMNRPASVRRQNCF